jgi:hypothetical protein
MTQLRHGVKSQIANSVISNCYEAIRLNDEADQRPRKITIRLTDEEFLALDAKRAATGTKFQQLGLKLLLDWLKGEGVSEIKDSGGIAKTLPGKYSGSAAGDQGQSEDWRVEMAREVLNSEHPVAGVALTANIISFGLLVRQQSTHNHAALDPEFRARIQKAREENERIRAAIEELRGKSARSGKPLPAKRGA